MPSHIRNYVERVEAETKEVCDQFEEMNNSFIDNYGSYADPSDIESMKLSVYAITVVFEDHISTMNRIKNNYRRATEQDKKNGIFHTS